MESLRMKEADEFILRNNVNFWRDLYGGRVNHTRNIAEQ